MTGGLVRGRALEERLRAVAAALEVHRGLWEPAPFLGLPAGWEARYGEVAAWVESLSEGEIDRFEAEISDVRTAPGAPEALLGWLDEVEALSALPAWPREPLARPLDTLCIAARKGEQIRCFVEAVLPHLPSRGPLVDWCAGKGHLARSLVSASGRSALALELDGALVQSGAALAAKLRVPGLQFVNADATTPAATDALAAATGAVALHACGHLGDHLMRGASERGLGFLAVAPCCYWRLGGAEVYRPRSTAGRETDLRLDLSRLRLACHEERTGSARQFAERRRRMAWRLGLDLLNRAVTGCTVYTPPPVGFRDLLNLPFREFCEGVSARLGVALPPRWDPAEAEAAGWAEVRRVRAAGLVRAPFRRPLELWLALDRAVALVEAGYDVCLGTFCPEVLTPRNLLIVAQRANESL